MVSCPRLAQPLFLLSFARVVSYRALQESPEVVPTGEMPRNIIVVLDRNLVDKVSPGTRVSIMGIASLYNSAAAKKQVGGVAIRTPFMQASWLAIGVKWACTRDLGGGGTSGFSCLHGDRMQEGLSLQQEWLYTELYVHFNVFCFHLVPTHRLLRALAVSSRHNDPSVHTTNILDATAVDLRFDG